jgi:CBS domain-containing protein
VKTSISIQAKDIMQRDIVKLDPSMPIESAIQTLDELEISGAPVVDEGERLLGVLSTRDVTRAEHVHSGRIEATRGEWTMSEPPSEEEEGDANENAILEKEDYSPALFGSDTVAQWMNRKFVMVDPDASLREVCRQMSKEHVHRVIVAREKKLVGVITSSDVVRCVAEARLV